HREVALRGAVSGGTVSKSRQQLRAEMPLCRNTESAVCVSFTCREDDDEQSSTGQDIEIIGGPGRIRRRWQAIELTGCFHTSTRNVPTKMPTNVGQRMRPSWSPQSFAIIGISSINNQTTTIATVIAAIRAVRKIVGHQKAL